MVTALFFLLAFATVAAKVRAGIRFFKWKRIRLPTACKSCNRRDGAAADAPAAMAEADSSTGCSILVASFQAARTGSGHGSR